MPAFGSPGSASAASDAEIPAQDELERSSACGGDDRPRHEVNSVDFVAGATTVDKLRQEHNAAGSANIGTGSEASETSGNRTTSGGNDCQVGGAIRTGGMVGTARGHGTDHAAPPDQDEHSDWNAGEPGEPSDRDGAADHGRHEAVPADTAAAVAYWYRRDPSMHPADIAAKIGRSERTVRRYWPPPPERHTNGHQAGRLAEQLGAS
ncbi:hypothetical protein ACQP2P_01770 [Dactylosporangium sp. CA-139114]|uniref:hypothetical protein n=1 Tax=Dactylosporangium sp. CA-139114 TaxID=3239931 RepID=UPI003D97C6EA